MRHLLISVLICFATVLVTTAQVQIGTAQYALPWYQFGWSVDLSSNGKVLAVGAPWSNRFGHASGQVRVYEWNGNDWTQLGNSLNGRYPQEMFGRAISLSSDGTVLAVGAMVMPYLQDTGYVKVYHYDGVSWTQLGNRLSGKKGGDLYGYAVDLSDGGTILAVGATGLADTGFHPGYVSVYELSDNTWLPFGVTIHGQTDEEAFGSSVELSGDGRLVAAGAPNSDGVGLNRGRVRVFTKNGSLWEQKGSAIDGVANDDLSGWDISISADGNILAIGVPKNDDNAIDAGQVRVYNWDGSAWMQMGQDILGPGTDDVFGTSVSISSDGSFLSIGAPGEFQFSTDSGTVHFYKWNANAWQPWGTRLKGDTAHALFGQSVGLSSDATTVAVGAPLDHTKGLDAGQVKTYSLVPIGIGDPPEGEMVVYHSLIANQLTIRFKREVKDLQVEVFGTLAQLIWRKTYGSRLLVTEELSGSSGIYWVRLHGEIEGQPFREVLSVVKQ